MKIVKTHKIRSAHSEQFGLWSGKTLADIPVRFNDYQVSFGGVQDKIDHIKVGNLVHEAFLWFTDMQEVREFGQKLVELAEEAERRQQNAG